MFSFSTAQTEKNSWKKLGKTRLVVWWFDVTNNTIQNFHSFNKILFLGLRCEKNINDCFGSPCKHGGRCTDGNNNFSCDCDDDWLGNTCEIKNLCKDIDCKNSGKCKYDNGNFTCHCEHPYNGPTCNMARK